MVDSVKTPKIGLSRLTETIPAAFSSFYLTLISMIQGVALGLLANKIPDFLSPFEPVGFLYILLTFTVIVIVWHEYVLSAQEFWWELKWRDSLIPFSLGMGEFLMIEYLGKGPNYHAWFFAAALTGSAGFFAYVNYDRWLEESDFEKPTAFQLFKNEVKRGRKLLLAFAIMNLVSGGFILHGAATREIVLLGCVCGLFLFLMVHKRLAWLGKALQIYGWRR